MRRPRERRWGPPPCCTLFETQIQREQVVRIDPVSGALTIVGTLPPAYERFLQGVHAFDRATDRLFTRCEGTQAQLSHLLLTINVVSCVIVNSTVLDPVVGPSIATLAWGA